MTRNSISSLAWLSGSRRSLRAWSWTCGFGRDAICSLETVSSSLWMHCWTTLPSVPWGLLDYTSQHTLGAMNWRQSLPSGCAAGLHFPASLVAMRPCDNSAQSDTSRSDAGRPVSSLYCFPLSWLSGMHMIPEQSLLHTGP